ncbi:hypothetical protein NP233_g4734 [Leucocoprinus birnbaumii]|uniref:Uncharacterized protein n=1 Tax=Leucocoprinus birnbaumii TaxID=56174 RepID=A0AAD5VUR8_9AGAR|nr:hypothetical protein NP233_g4734 [Leucocoprinus birnbaumii]
MYCLPQLQTNPNTSLIHQQEALDQYHSTREEPNQLPLPDTTAPQSDDNSTSGGAGGGNNIGGVCVPRACRRDEFPFGFPSDSPLPPLCSSENVFCPDNGSGCRSVLSVGSPCELGRDEQCAVPQGLGSGSQFNIYKDKGLTNKGALCLNRSCTYVNATLAYPCIVENTTYTFPSPASHSLYTLSVIRHNCLPELYCDPTDLICLKARSVGEPCIADFECVTATCELGTCVNSLEFSYEVTSRQWAILITAIFIGIGDSESCGIQNILSDSPLWKAEALSLSDSTAYPAVPVQRLVTSHEMKSLILTGSE